MSNCATSEPHGPRTRHRRSARSRRVLALIALCLVSVGFVLPPAQRTSAQEGGSVFTVNNANDSGPGSLREAIEFANMHDTKDIIKFAIPLSDTVIVTQTILLITPLPEISHPVVIDGWSQGGPDYAGPPLIEISGSRLITPGPGLRLGPASSNSEIRGLAIYGFKLSTPGKGASAGIEIEGGQDRRIWGNYIGFGSGQLRQNLEEFFPGNSGEGIRVISATRSIIEQNHIAINGTQGVLVSGGTDNQITGNSIYKNGTHGVLVTDGTGHRISRNSIHDNTLLGINLGNDGVTENDLADADQGPNDLQNFPSLGLASPEGTPASPTIIVEGELHTTPGTTSGPRNFTVEFFGNDTCDESEHGEGHTFLGSHTVTTDVNGAAPFVAELQRTAALTQVTALATDADGNTSEFSQCREVKRGNDTWIRAQELMLGAAGDGQLSATVRQHIYRDGQARWFTFDITPEALVTVALSGLPENYDLWLYRDISRAYNQAETPEDIQHLNAELGAVLQTTSNPDSVDGAPGMAPDTEVDDDPAFVSNPGAVNGAPGMAPDSSSPDYVDPDSPPDADAAAYRSAQARSIIAVSAADGKADELISARTWHNTGEFYVRVRGRNGVSSRESPFTLTVSLAPANACQGVLPVPTIAESDPLSPAASGKQTLILTDLDRMPGADAERQALWSDLLDFAERTEINGVVVDVGDYESVHNASEQADAHPGCTFAKNEVARTIKAVIDRYRQDNSLKYIVLVGGDDVIPFFRHIDRTIVGKENMFYPPVEDRSASNASLRRNYVLSDLDYGASRSIGLAEGFLPRPSPQDPAVGRLVETAAEARNMLRTYTSNGGVISATNSLVTGYDFFADGAKQIDSVFKSSGLTTDTLITKPAETPWSVDQLKTALTSRPHQIMFLGAHFSDSRLIAADFRTRLSAGEFGELGLELNNILVLSLGCHSGYNTVDGHAIPGVTRQPDWAQLFARNGTTLVAGTGYQYGDYIQVEYGERLYADFASKLLEEKLPLGEALRDAKLEYLARVGDVDGYHQKTLLEATLYGLPMVRVKAVTGAATRAESTTASALATSSTTTATTSTAGDPVAEALVTVTPTLTETTVAFRGDLPASYYEGDDGTTSLRIGAPILPVERIDAGAQKNRLNLTDSDQFVLRGVGLRAGEYRDITGARPVVALPVWEQRMLYPPFCFREDVFYPPQPWRVNVFQALAGGAAQVLALPAQYRSDIGCETSTARVYDSLTFQLFYSNQRGENALVEPPGVYGITAIPSIAGDSVKLSVRATSFPETPVRRVWVTYTAEAGPLVGRWVSLDLAKTAVPNEWSGLLEAEALAGTDPAALRFMVQAANDAGLVTLKTNYGRFYTPSTAVAPSRESTTLRVLTPSDPPPIGAALPITAELRSSSGEPVAGQMVIFRVRDESYIRHTNKDGQAEILWTLAELGRMEIQAIFPGSGAHQPTHSQTSVVIGKQTPQLRIKPSSATAQFSDRTGLVVALLDEFGRAIGSRRVDFNITGTRALAGTEEILVRELALDDALLARLPPGTYQVTARAPAAPEPLFSEITAAAALTVVRETATITYTGDLVASHTAPLTLAAQVLQQQDGQPIDFATIQNDQMTVRFAISDGSGSIVREAIAPVTWDDALDKPGIAEVTMADPLPVGVYAIATTLQSEILAGSSSDLLAVYDPAGGHVSGGGWIESPAGAYVNNPDLAGKASFGFVSKQQQGATTPTGETEFEFKLAGLKFHSSSYEWLVVSGAKAQFKGSGSLNHESGYGFLLTAVDGDRKSPPEPDRFRIKIWNKATGEVVYDNQQDTAENADLTSEGTLVQPGGMIIIHK